MGSLESILQAEAVKAAAAKGYRSPGQNQTAGVRRGKRTAGELVREDLERQREAVNLRKGLGLDEESKMSGPLPTASIAGYVMKSCQSD